MANNITAPGVGEVLATEEISGAHLSRVKLALGASGADGGDVSSANPMPITAPSNIPVAVATALPSGDNNIGNVDVASLPALPAGANAIGTVGVSSLPAIPAGTNNIGDVDVATLPATPAGTNLIGKVAAGIDFAGIYSGAVAAIATRVSSVVAASGDSDLYTPAAGKKARVLAALIMPLGEAVNVALKLASDDVLGAAATPVVLDASGATGLPQLVLPYNPLGWFEGAADEKVRLNASSTEPVQVLLVVVDM